MKFNVIVHPAEEGGYWAEIPAIPGCATQGESMAELMENAHEAIEACLSIHGSQPLKVGLLRHLIDFIGNKVLARKNVNFQEYFACLLPISDKV